MSPALTLPPMFAGVARSKVGVTAASLALVDRTHQIFSAGPTPASTPPRNRSPFEFTSSVPQTISLGMLTGSIQVNPPSMERLNCRPGVGLLAVLHHWY